MQNRWVSMGTFVVGLMMMVFLTSAAAAVEPEMSASAQTVAAVSAHLPDLVVKDVRIPKPIGARERVAIRVFVRNQGTGVYPEGVEYISARMEFDGAEVDFEFPLLDENETRMQIVYFWFPHGGWYRVTTQVDVEGAIPERDEENNRAEERVRVKGPSGGSSPGGCPGCG